jgi:hypothetical protein
MFSLRIVSLVVLACGGLSSCSWLAEEPEETPAANPNAPKLVGRIASIPVNQSFVLIESYGAWRVAAGTVLTTRGPEGRTANLLSTGESLGHYAAADVQSGKLAQGDAVYAPPSASTKAADPTEKAADPAAEAQAPATQDTAKPATNNSSKPAQKEPVENSKKNNQPF